MSSKSHSSAHATHGELKQQIADRLGTDPERYSSDLGVERHKRLTNREVTRICEELGMGFLRDEVKQDRRNAIMQRLGRDHRVGASEWDTSDLRAVIEVLYDNSPSA